MQSFCQPRMSSHLVLDVVSKLVSSLQEACRTFPSACRYAWYKLYNLAKGYNKNLTSSDVQMLAGNVLLSALSISPYSAADSARSEADAEQGEGAQRSHGQSSWLHSGKYRILKLEHTAIAVTILVFLQVTFVSVCMHWCILQLQASHRAS